LHIVPNKQKQLSKPQQQLLRLFDRLDEQNRETLLAFAEFLGARESTAEEIQGDSPIQSPRAIERPQQESVVKAIKRLSETYYMLERELLLDQTSSLMMSHVMQGRDAVSVIDELENIFQEHYQRYLQALE
jgi:hypothetical protein